MGATVDSEDADATVERAGRMASGEGVIGLLTPAADIVEVCGWLGPLLVNVFHSQLGVNLATFGVVDVDVGAVEIRETDCRRAFALPPACEDARSFAVLEVAVDAEDIAELERAERMDPCEGEVLNCLYVA